MKKIVLMVIILVANITAQAQDYNTSKIPDALLKDAVAVVRNEEQHFEFKSIGSGKAEYKIAITILNKAGDQFAEMFETYDKFSTINNVKASLYDATGKRIKEYKSSDFRDQSLVSDYSIFEDNRAKILKFYSLTYPYTIEYSYTQDYKGVLYFPSWKSIKGYGISTEKSVYSLIKGSGLNIKFLTSKGLPTDSSTVNDKVLYKWQANNVAAVVNEPMSIGFDEIVDWVKASPTQFEYESTTGNFDTWKNFGTWMHKLNENANTLPTTTKQLVQNLVKDAKTPKEKIQLLYNHLQQNTRYVSVQLGIGGFKPILAEKVAQVNYGDCKALSNYMKALLNEVGIKSNLIVIGNGMPSLNVNYSSMGQANHMILCVPLEKDTTFLECTSQYVPMGFIGNDNADRNVLMITEDGGKIMHTPVYSAKDNYQIRKTKINILDNETAEVGMKCTYGYAQFEDNLSSLLTEPVEQRKRLVESIDIPGAELLSFKYDQPNKTLPVLTEEINLKGAQVLTKGGEKAFLTLNMVNRRENVPAKLESRKTYFAVNFSYQDEDEISYTLPKSYHIEFLPKDITLTSEFGTYTAKFAAKDNSIVYTRTQVMTAKNFPPEKYNEYIDFYKKIYQADKQKAVLTKTTP